MKKPSQYWQSCSSRVPKADHSLSPRATSTDSTVSLSPVKGFSKKERLEFESLKLRGEKSEGMNAELIAWTLAKLEQQLKEVKAKRQRDILTIKTSYKATIRSLQEKLVAGQRKWESQIYKIHRYYKEMGRAKEEEQQKHARKTIEELVKYKVLCEGLDELKKEVRNKELQNQKLREELDQLKEKLFTERVGHVEKVIRLEGDIRVLQVQLRLKNNKHQVKQIMKLKSSKCSLTSYQKDSEDQRTNSFSTQTPKIKRLTTSCIKFQDTCASNKRQCLTNPRVGCTAPKGSTEKKNLFRTSNSSLKKAKRGWILQEEQEKTEREEGLLKILRTQANLLQIYMLSKG